MSSWQSKAGKGRLGGGPRRDEDNSLAKVPHGVCPPDPCPLGQGWAQAIFRSQMTNSGTWMSQLLHSTFSGHTMGTHPCPECSHVNVRSHSGVYTGMCSTPRAGSADTAMDNHVPMHVHTP
jgi:hypothetical protein